MTPDTVAGVDWAGGEWLAVTFQDYEYERCMLTQTFGDLWEELGDDIHCMLVDVPIGLPDNEEKLGCREELDSMARKMTGRPSSVFPVPSRSAARMAYEDDADYEEVVEQNERDLGKGMNKQSYHIAAGIGEVDALLCNNDDAKTKIIESHPELCFRGLLDEELQNSKDTAAGVGERFNALRNQLDEPGALLEEVTRDLVNELDEGGNHDVAIDDVIDAIGLGVVASKFNEECQIPSQDYETDTKGLPMRMAYWAEDQLTTDE